MICTARRRRGLLALALGLLAGPPAAAQLRVVTWNVTQYTGGRVADIQTAVYGQYEGRALAPDIILAQEFLSYAAMTAFRSALNSAPGSPGDWDGRYVPGPGGSEGSTLLFRTGKLVFLSSTIVSQGGPAPDPPRNTVRFALRLQGYSSDGGILCCYNSHMKSQDSGSEDEARRLLEAQRIRADAATLNPAWHFLLGADLNIMTSSEAAYQELVGSQAGSAGRFFDPINTPGTWNNNYAFRFVHTQDPVGPGGMDDRYDQILIGARLCDGTGLDYIGNPALPYSTLTWADPNHSYRAWGNDGWSFDQELRTTGNQMVGEAIAVALRNLAQNAGHLPVLLDLRVPPEIGSDALIDFGRVPQGAPAEAPLSVWNAGDVGLWTAAGIADLHYTLAASPGFTAPDGPFAAAAGQAPNTHLLTMDTAACGPVTGTLTIASDAPDEPVRTVTLRGEIVAAWQPGDLNCDGAVDFVDIDPFVLALAGAEGYYAAWPECDHTNADCNADGLVDFADIDPFVARLTGGGAP